MKVVYIKPASLKAKSTKLPRFLQVVGFIVIAAFALQMVARADEVSDDGSESAVVSDAPADISMDETVSDAPAESVTEGAVQAEDVAPAEDASVAEAAAPVDEIPEEEGTIDAAPTAPTEGESIVANFLAGTDVVTPVLNTDKPEYFGGETIGVSGFGFTQGQMLTLKIVGGSSEGIPYSLYEQPIAVDVSGNFTTEYQIANSARYVITAVDEAGQVLNEIIVAPLSQPSEDGCDGDEDLLSRGVLPGVCFY